MDHLHVGLGKFALPSLLVETVEPDQSRPNLIRQSKETLRIGKLKDRL